MLSSIIHTALFVLKLANYSLSLAVVRPRLLSISTLLYAVKTIFLELQDSGVQDKKQTKNNKSLLE